MRIWKRKKRGIELHFKATDADIRLISGIQLITIRFLNVKTKDQILIDKWMKNIFNHSRPYQVTFKLLNENELELNVHVPLQTYAFRFIINNTLDYDKCVTLFTNNKKLEHVNIFATQYANPFEE